MHAGRLSCQDSRPTSRADFTAFFLFCFSALQELILLPPSARRVLDPGLSVRDEKAKRSQFLLLLETGTGVFAKNNCAKYEIVYEAACGNKQVVKDAQRERILLGGKNRPGRDVRKGSAD